MELTGIPMNNNIISDSSIIPSVGAGSAYDLYYYSKIYINPPRPIISINQPEII
jgi:hypothetical protein